MKVAHVIFSLTPGGAELMLIDIINQQNFHAVIGLFIINDDINNSLLNGINEKVKVFFIKRKKGTSNPLPLIKLNILLSKFKPDVIHCHNHNIIRVLVKPFQKKAVLTIHDTGIPTSNYKKYRQLFAISNSVSKDVFLRSGFEPNVIFNGVDIKSILIKSRFDHSSFYKIVQVSRLQHEKKGQNILIEAISLLDKQNIKNIQIDFIGEGQSEGYLKDLVLRNGLEDRVKFLGLKDRHYIYNHLKDYDLLVQPSLYEGFGLTIVEALAANVPVLATAIEGPQEILKILGTGVMFEPGNINECAKKILLTMNSQHRYNEHVLNKVNENFNIRETANRYLHYYNAIC